MKSSVACVVLGKSSATKNKILIAHRINKGQMGGRWEFPGGKVDNEENDKETIAREMLEEFGESVLVGERIAVTDFEHNGEKNCLRAYEVFFNNDGLEKPFSLTEHSEVKWVSFDEIPLENFVDSDLKLLPSVKEYIEKNYGKE
ncbi:MAG: NUDIX domain-containing protein [Treponema sp.]|nr:NUDIX domain-containing protein [Treponema sp.]MBQ7619414.1 NUDIX domain-containing protein [Treponema sp.]MBQ9626927.1 NUDIX domain-containing protein [Treponema sp.]